MNAPISPHVLEALAAFDTCRIANAIEQFDVRLRNEGFSNPQVQCRFPEMSPTVGYAVTLRVRSSNPPMQGGFYAEQTDWWDHLGDHPVPHVLVIQDLDHQDSRGGAFVGEVHAAILRAMQCVGVVTNGAVRDLPEVKELGLQLFSGSVSVSHGYVHVVDVGAPVEIAGMRIRPGDLLHGDRHGLVKIPSTIAAEIPPLAERLQKHEEEILDYCQSSAFNPAGLRKLLAAR